MTLDFYNASRKIAVEVDGNQHYKFNKFFHSNSRQKFLAQLQRDDKKEYFCEINNIKLARVLESDKLSEELLKGLDIIFFISFSNGKLLINNPLHLLSLCSFNLNSYSSI